MCISLVFAIVLSLKLAYIKIQVFGYAHKFFHVGLISKGVPKRLFFAFYAIQGSQKQQPKCVIVSKPLLCTSKLLFELRCLCMFLSVCPSFCKNFFSSKMDQIRKVGEQTSRILEFKPEGLEGQYNINNKFHKEFLKNF